MDIDLIDDEIALNELYQCIIEEEGFKVNGFNSAEDYIEYTENQIYRPPSLAVITDVRMPGKSGYQLIEEIQKINPKQRFVVITGTPQDECINDLRACFYVQKPINVDKLIAVIKLLSSCEVSGNKKILAHECKLLSDLNSFDIHDWYCPHLK